MKILLSFLVLFICITTKLSAQDIITLKNNYTIDAKNIVVTPKEVRYQDYYDNSAEMLVLQKSKVSSILYENGSTVNLYNIQKTTHADVGNNLLTFHFLDFVINNFTISYERIIANGKYGIQIPFSFGYSDETTTVPLPPPTSSDYTNYLVNRFYTGIKFNIYPTGQGKVKYFLGPEIRFGTGLLNQDYYNYNNPYTTNTGYIKFFINNGVVFTFANSLSISAVGSIGIQHMYKIDTNPTQTTGALSINLSYRF